SGRAREGFPAEGGEGRAREGFPGQGEGGRAALRGAARLLSQSGGGGRLLDEGSRGGALAPDRRGGDRGEGHLLPSPGRQLRLARGSRPLPGRLEKGRAFRRHRHARGWMMEIKRVPKPWGHELWWAQTEHYVGKILFVKAGHKLSLQYHER